MITGAQVTRVLLDGEAGALSATRRRVPHRRRATPRRSSADKEVVLSAGAIGSPHLLMLSGIGPRHELEAAGVACRLDAPDVGKHLKDHLQVALFFPAPGRGRVDERDRRSRWVPTRCARPAGPLPADPADDATCPTELQALKREAERRVAEWATTGRGLGVVVAATRRAPGSRPDSATSTRHDAQLGFFCCGYTTGPAGVRCCASIPTSTSTTPPKRLAPDAETMIVLANPVQPHSEGEIVLDQRRSRRPPRHPHELLRRPARHGSDDRGAPPGARHRRALAGAPRDRPADDPARRSPRSTATSPGDTAERRTARGPRAALLLTVYHPHRPAGSAASSIRACGCWVSAICVSRTRASCPTS